MTALSKPSASREALSANPRLLCDGEANPFDFWRNKADYDFVCPREEYVQSPQSVTLIQLSRKWNVSYMTLQGWKNRQGWERLREREWKAIAERSWELSKDSIAKIQATEITDQLHHWRLMRSNLEAAMRRGGEEEQSATGKINFRAFSMKERKDAAAIMQMIDGEINRILGMGKGLVKAGEEDETTPTAKPVRMVRHNYTVEVTEYKDNRNEAPDEMEASHQNPQELSAEQPFPALELPDGTLVAEAVLVAETENNGEL